MKQKLLNTTLYVFDVNPYIITEDASEATVIKVQEESYKGFVELNPDLVDKLTKYNYHAMVVNVPEWAPYVEQEDPQGSLTFGIYGSAAADAINQIQVQNAENVILQSWVAGVDLEFPFQCNVEEGQHCVIECKDNVDLSQGFDVTGMEYLPVAWTDAETNRKWYATQPISESISIGINAAEPSTYTVILTGTGLSAETVTIKNGGETVALAGSYTVEKDAWFEIYPLQDPSYYTLVSENMEYDTEQGNEHWYVMPSRTGSPYITIELNCAAPVSTHTVEITSDIAMAKIMEQTFDHQTIVNTYTSPSSPFTVTVNDGNIVTVEFDNGEPAYIYNVSPNGFFAGQWQNPDTGKYISFSEPISDDVNVTIQPRTYKFVLEGSNIHQNVTVKVNGETTSYTPEQLVDGVQLNDGDVIDVYPTQNVSDYSLVSGATWDTDHWTTTVNGADVDILINYLGAGVNFNARWYSGSIPENVDQINIGNTSVTGNDLTDTSWTETVRLNPGYSQIKYFISTGLPTDMETFKVEFEYQVDDHTESEIHMASKETDPVTGEITYSDLYNPSAPLTNPGIWTYDNTPETGLPWIAFTLPSTNNYGNAFADNTDMIITASVTGS